MMVVAALLLAFQSANSIDPSPPAAIALPAREILIPGGTAMRFVTTVELDSRTARQGQRFAMSVEHDVTIAGSIVIPRGTVAVGEVDSVSQKGMFGRPGSLAMEPLFVEFNGHRLYVDGGTHARGGNGEAAAIVTTALVGGIGLFITGKSARVPVGTSLVGWLKNDTLVTTAAP